MSLYNKTDADTTDPLNDALSNKSKYDKEKVEKNFSAIDWFVDDEDFEKEKTEPVQEIKKSKNSSLFYIILFLLIACIITFVFCGIYFYDMFFLIYIFVISVFLVVWLVAKPFL